MWPVYLHCLFACCAWAGSSGVGSAAAAAAPAKSPGYPVVLLPGDGGSQIQVKLNKTKVPHFFCDKVTTDFYDAWLNLELLAPRVLDCLIDNLKLDYNRTTRKTHDQPGVTSRIPGWGETQTVEWLDSSHVYPTSYFNTIVQTLVNAGYQRGLSVRGAPYDFRRAPNELARMYSDFKELVEETSRKNSNQPCIVICHSFGNVIFHHFLRKKTSEAWRKKYVRAFVAISGPFSGSMKTLRVERSLPSTAFLLPNPRFWDPYQVLASTSTKNYTVTNYKEFFQDIGNENGYEYFLDTKDIVDSLNGPGVEVHCINGKDVPTAQSFHWPEGTFPDTQPQITYEKPSGDGTVNYRSLMMCPKFARTQKQKVYHREYSGAEHEKILWNADLAQYVLKKEKVYHREYSGAQHAQIMWNKDLANYVLKLAQGKALPQAPVQSEESGEPWRWWDSARSFLHHYFLPNTQDEEIASKL